MWPILRDVRGVYPEELEGRLPQDEDFVGPSTKLNAHGAPPRLRFSWLGLRRLFREKPARVEASGAPQAILGQLLGCDRPRNLRKDLTTRLPGVAAP